jgi:H+/Cl- antiporter ClcA
MPGNPLTDPDLPASLADSIDRVVGTVRDRVTDKAVTAVRGVVFGVIIGIASLAVAILLVIVVTKFVQRLSRVVFQVDYATSVWIGYLIMAGLFALGGAIAMRLRHTPADVPTAP